MALYYTTANALLKEEFSCLKPTTGYCIFIDIVDSVALKDQGMEVWCAAIHNVISKSSYWLDGFESEIPHTEKSDLEKQCIGLLPLKIIGDCVMFFIPLNSMPRGATALSIFHSLQTIIKDAVYPKREVRIAATFCEDSHKITFVKEANDIYGKDIDLAARLL